MFASQRLRQLENSVAQAAQGRTTFVLDTSVLLTAGRQALVAFAEHEVVLPLVVITELEGRRNDPEMGWIARQVLRALEELRVATPPGEPGLDSKLGVVVTPEGGTLRIEINHIDQSPLPDALRRESTHDVRILAVAKGLSTDGARVVVVSRDLPMRLVAGAVLGMAAEDYRNDQAVSDGYTGIIELTLSKDEMDNLYSTNGMQVEGDEAPVNTGVIMGGYTGGGAIGVVTKSLPGGYEVKLIRQNIEAFGLKPHSAEQRIAMHHLLDVDTSIVSMGGRAGTGKSVLALAAGLEAVLERREQKKVVIFRPMYSVGGQDLGFLPGTAEEKMGPWAAAVYDALGSFCSPEIVKEIAERELIEVLPLTHIRGRTLHDCFVIVDESQNLERPVLLSALSRLGQGSKVVLTHDVAQRDNLHVGRHDGIATVIERLKGNDLFAHVTLTKSERSPVAELVTRLLDGGE